MSALCEKASSGDSIPSRSVIAVCIVCLRAGFIPRTSPRRRRCGTDPFDSASRPGTLVGSGEMFNPMSTAEVVRAVGAVLEASAGGGSDDGYRRGQVLSAFSVCRHLAAEEQGRRDLMEWLEAASAPILVRRGEAQLSAARPEEAGARLASLMAELREADDEGSRTALRELRHLLREICDREIAILAAAT
jgi:hypothetical protein